MSSKKRAVFRTSGSEVLQLTITNTNQCVGFSLDPSNFSDRLKNLSLGFEYYRFTKAVVRVPPQTRWETSLSSGFNNSAQTAAFAYLPEAPVGSVSGLGPSTLLAIVPSKPFQYNLAIEGAASTFIMSVPGNTQSWEFRIPKGVLLGVPGKWYRNNTISEDPLGVQGTFLVAVADAAGSNTVQFQAQLLYEIEFTGQANNAVV
jgi:hypothetical protein